MSLASRITNVFSSSTTSKEEKPDLPLQKHNIDSTSDVLSGNSGMWGQSDTGRAGGGAVSDTMSSKLFEMKEEDRPPYLHALIAGGIGGTAGDFIMHSLDTVKTRQQGDPHMPPKYTTLLSSYSTILRQEGVVRGLYGGCGPAMLGSFPGTIIFFGTYEFSKRNLIDVGCNPQLAYLASGFIADFASSFVYVPSEVLKTRLQLQGRYNNPHFNSGYNYRSTRHALSTIVRTEGLAALFYGYRATISRDLPYSALQFTFYEQGQTWSRQWKKSKDIGLGLELLTGAAAGGLAGVITCPLDVVKTRIQTQVNPPQPLSQGSTSAQHPPPNTPLTQAKNSTRTNIVATPAAPSSPPRPLKPSTKNKKIQFRNISTSSPSTHTPKPGAINLDTSSVITGLKLIYKTEGISGWFRGVGPRFLWTSVQSGVMLWCYQKGLKALSTWLPVDEEVREGVM